MTSRAVLSWSGGKDSALALHEVRRSTEFEVASLLTTLTKGFDRISMHGVRKALLDLQAERLGVPVDEVWIEKGAPNTEYEAELSKALARRRSLGVSHVIFGDLFLEDIRKYREDRLSSMGLACVFPLWMKDTRKLAAHFIDEGFRAIICAVDPRFLDGVYCGREFDRSFLSELPPGVDPCGENGEFHTFVYGGPIFEKDLKVRPRDTVFRDGFYFTDILPG